MTNFIEEQQKEAEKNSPIYTDVYGKYIDQIIAQTITNTLNHILESGLLEEKDYVYEDENKEHNEFESTLEHHETMGEAHHSGHNTLARANKEFISNMDKE